MANFDGLTIVEAVQYLKKTGFESVGRQTLRQYESAGLINPRRKNKYRVYMPEDLDRLELVLMLRDLGFPISEIRKTVNHWDEVNKISFDIFKSVRDTGIVDSSLKIKACGVKEAFENQIKFINDKIICRIQDKIALYESRMAKQKQKIDRLENSSKMIDEIIRF